MSRLSDPRSAPSMSLVPDAPRWRSRLLGVFVLAVAFAALAVAAWRYEFSAPPAESAPTVLPRQ